MEGVDLNNHSLLIEIEGPSEAVVRKYVDTLGFTYEDGCFGGVGVIYEKYFSIPREYINFLPEITFQNPPPKPV